jgi:hypothetical protein
MELELLRTYFPNGTNGEIIHNGEHLSYSIELPWLANKHNISCIPEGKYRMVKNYTKRHGLHLLLLDVPGRDAILIHPANDAKRQLLGCIAPVSILTGEGKGLESRIACDKVYKIAFDAIERKETVFITIKVEKVEKVERVEEFRGLEV